MELQQLRYFTAVARLGNFTRAAAACHVSQPTLSQQVAKLEMEIGQPLFHRGSRVAELTDAGRAFQMGVEQALTLLDDAKESVIASGKVQRLTIAAIPTIAPYLLPEVLIAFMKVHPTARLEVKEYTTDECLQHLTDGELDLAILALPVRGDHLANESLFEEELQLVMPREHRLATKSQIRWKDLSDEPFILLHEAHCLSGQALGFCARHALAPLTTAKLHQLGTVLELVRLGHGISLVPAMAATRDRDTGRVYRSLSGEKPNRTIAVVWSKLRFRSPLFEPFMIEVRKTIERQK